MSSLTMTSYYEVLCPVEQADLDVHLKLSTCWLRYRGNGMQSPNCSGASRKTTQAGCKSKRDALICEYPGTLNGMRKSLAKYLKITRFKFYLFKYLRKRLAT